MQKIIIVRDAHSWAGDYTLKDVRTRFKSWSMSELIRAVEALEERMTRLYEDAGMTRSDAQSVVEAIIIKSN